jgi:hypothetical protein
VCVCVCVRERERERERERYFLTHLGFHIVSCHMDHGACAFV